MIIPYVRYALVALAVRHLVGARVIFDMRASWPDEKVDAAAKRWKRRFVESAVGPGAA